MLLKIIYRHVKRYLQLLPYVVTHFYAVPYDGVVASGQTIKKVYPYWKMSPSRVRFFALDWKSTPCSSPFLIIQNIF